MSAATVTLLPPSATTTTHQDAGYRCSACSRVFRRQAACRRHEFDAHSDAGRHRCPACSKTFASRAALATHRATHDDDLGRRGVQDETSRGGSTAVEDCCVDDEICLDEDGEELHQATMSLERDMNVDLNDNNNDVKATDLLAAADKTSPSRVADNAIDFSVQVKEEIKDEISDGLDVHGGSCRKRRLSETTVRPTSPGQAHVDVVKPKVVCRGPSINDVQLNPPAATRFDDQTTELRRQPAELIMTSECDDRKLTGTILNVSNGVFATAINQPPQKIIVYVKTDANQPQQSQYICENSSTKPAASGQFVCPVCRRDFVTEKYLSMHISSIHKTASTPPVDGGMGVDVAQTLRRVVTVSAAAFANSADGRAIISMEAATPSTFSAGGIVWSQQQITSVAAAAAAAAPTASKTQWTCHICNKAFAQNSSYKNHVRTHSDDRPYVCSICSIGFKERYHLKKHALFKHTTELNETCRVCGKRFKDSTAVRAHERIHSDVRPYGCTLCGKTFKTSECLWHHENRSKTCGKMAAAAAAAAGGADRINRVRHSADQPTPVAVPHRRQRRMTTTAVVAGNQHHQQQTAVEKLTNVSVAAERRVEVVIQRSTPSPPQQQQPPSVCELSDVKEPHAGFSHDMANVETVVDSQPAAVKSEPDCELFDVNLNAMLESEDQSFEDFWQNFDIDSTQENTDEASSTTETASSSPETTDSEATAADETALLKDLVSAASSATSPSVVASSTAGGAGLSASKRFDCTRCEKRFASAATLEKHLLVHAEIRPYRCTVCDIGFKLKVHLKKHNLYRHSEEYPCECSICGKRFKDSSAVRLHERIHSSDRPFQCAHCGKSFKTRENLWGHRNRGPCDKSLMLPNAAAPSGVVAGSDVTQRFVANNIRLFHSAEFGPILGVPVNATKLVLKEVQCSVGRSGIDSSSTSTPVLSLQAVCSSSGGAVIVTSAAAAAAGYLPQRLSAVRLGQAQTRTVMSAVSPLTVPTAVVTPIKRDTVDCSSPDVTASAAAAPPTMTAASAAKTPSVSDRNVLLSRPVAVRPATLFQPDMRKRSKSASASIAAQCPTVQKFLACTGSTITVSNNTVSSNNNNEKLTESTVNADSCSSMFNETSIAEHSLTDAINVLTGSIVGESAREMMIEGDCLPSVDGLDGTDVDWPIVEECAILGTALGRLDKTDYSGRYHHQQRLQQQQDWVDLMSADQLLNSTDDDDLSDDSFADYPLMASPQIIGPTPADGAESSSGGGGVASGFDESSRDVKFDTSDFITPTSDAMWCGWPQDNDLNSLLIFGP